MKNKIGDCKSDLISYFAVFSDTNRYKGKALSLPFPAINKDEARRASLELGFPPLADVRLVGFYNSRFGRFVTKG